MTLLDPAALAPLIAALRVLRAEVLSNETRPSAEAIATRLTDLEAMAVAVTVRATTPRRTKGTA